MLAPLISPPRGGGVPGGASGEIQYNNSGAFGGGPLYREDANTIAQRNGATGQALLVYNKHTSDTVYERGFFRWAADFLTIGAEALGGGMSARRIRVISNSYMHLDGAGLFIRDFVLLDSPSDGVLQLVDGSGAAFNRVQFGGATSSFPALKRSATVMQARLADDSAFAPLQGNLRSQANAVAETPTATHTQILTDAGGTAYRVLCVV